MLANYTRSAQALSDLLQREGVEDKEVLKAIAQIPRHIFIDDVLKHKAYQNTALPIGQGQTISQPYIVARMTELMRLAGVKSKVLEIGTGSGYQTAVLAKTFDKVYSVERIKALQWQAKRRLHQLDLYNVTMKHGDGWQGWQSQAPFNGIIVTAAATIIPPELLAQLADGGVLLAPIGEAEQKLTMVIRQGDSFTEHVIAPVRFVPLVPGDIE
ncbi:MULTISPECIES: protein-L-isoaspartate(D-aspartate) O-methyltransferase [unclassified Pseudoalteromonas]|uniref:Protein-L-isoaspartate O-methyltransferase n=2 Tax=unclassified Pseudoalteromonas TaxID=194690 RepID=A0AB39AN50_9GAMM|nr:MULTISPECIES: protein-L-isoaspartate(D-aspartate) O-methyltransferase [unclassified Pseudoalteromonas]MDN3434221.1 protein-L-isoaspartate(D-aspartate) O-methyltransferase [Pseudoalteromonas sp. APC 3356]MDN3487620.1 protein-L-isoaspartate(D-aspartate) O-methyltransferase [Pseudoalteromonas sp. APC 3694]QWF32030.1 protein-L-isoaspartate(D-aspartate) O-methyltransferase [Pseudoalteromonas sp. SiA1]TMP50466.1 protein-L-isoaspartate(D-aspartate) O-methyltransferase [Pseudoalteromonas sp. S1688]